jgi:hypothetical protein
MAKIKIKHSENVENIALIKSPSRAHLTIHGYKILLCNIFVLSIGIAILLSHHWVDVLLS